MKGGEFLATLQRRGIHKAMGKPRQQRISSLTEIRNAMTLRKVTDLKKCHWEGELHGVFWSHRTPPREATNNK